MDAREKQPEPPKRKLLGSTLILVGVCGAMAILGIFIGIIVVYGGINAVQGG
jgi:hypothetical protein